MEKLIKIAISDFRLVFRDNSLKFFFIIPLLNLFVIRYGVPFAIEKFEVLNDFKAVILMAISIQGSLMFGFIYSMVLIDEKDTYVAKVYGILPVSKFWFVIFRLTAPFLLSTLATSLIFLVEPFYEISLAANLSFSVIAGFNAALMALFVSLRAKNKIEAMTWQKLYNIPATIPLLAFFVPNIFVFLFSIFPTFWAYQGLNVWLRNEGGYLYFLVGIVYSLLLIVLFTRKFTKNHFV